MWGFLLGPSVVGRLAFFSACAHGWTSFSWVRLASGQASFLGVQRSVQPASFFPSVWRSHPALHPMGFFLGGGEWDKKCDDNVVKYGIPGGTLTGVSIQGALGG